MTIRPLRSLSGFASPLAIIAALAFPAAALLAPVDAAAQVSRVVDGADGGAGGTSGNAAGGAGTGADGIGANAIAGDGETATGGPGTGGSGLGGPAVSGGATGAAGTTPGAVDLNQTTDIDHGLAVPGILVESTGGDGGAGGTSGDAAGGNAQGGNGFGGNAIAGNGGTAQGGTGTGGDALGGSATSGDASGGRGGDGGSISIDNSAGISTSAAGADGIRAVSQGGDGGAGGTSGNATGGTAFGGNGLGGNAAAGVGGAALGADGFGGDGFGGTALSGDADGGDGGDGGAISITNSGTIRTTGDGASGISAFSAGGLGGVGGSAGTASGGVGIGGLGTGGAPGGTAVNGLGTPGAATVGSAAAGADGTGGRISIVTSGEIEASGAGSYGIRAESVGGETEIVIGGSVSGGTGAGAGIWQEGAANNLSIEAGGTLEAASGLAARMSGAINAIDNAGLFIGNLTMIGGANSFDNLASGVVEAGTSLDLGGGIFANAGTFSPGGTGAVIVTSLTGNYTQADGGMLLVDADFGAGTIDRLGVSGTATLDASARIQLLSLDDAGANLTFFSSAGGLVNTGFDIADTPVVSYTLVQTGNDLAAQLDAISFAAPGLGANQAGVAAHLEAAFTGAFPEFDPTLLILANQPTLAAYAAALGRLTPEPYLALALGDLDAAERLRELMATQCRDAAGVGPGRDSCLWGSVIGAFDDYSGGSLSYQQGVIAAAGGFETEFATGWSVVGALGLESASFDVGDRAELDSTRFQGSLGLERRQGPFLFGFGVLGGYGTAEGTRFIDLDPAFPRAFGDLDTAYVGAHFRGAYSMPVRDWTVTPLVDLAVTHLMTDGFTETGAGPLALRVGEGEETVFSIRPGVEVDGATRMANGMTFRPYLFAGINFRPDAAFSTSAVFDTNPGLGTPFTVSAEIDPVTAELDLGFDILAGESTTFGVRYGLDVGANSVSHQATLSLIGKF